MTQDFFDAIVRLFVHVSTGAGISYQLLNVWVYCLFIPMTWCITVSLRLRSLRLGLTGTLIGMAAAIVTKYTNPTAIRNFYDHETAFLEILSSHKPMGYVWISLIIGVAAPLVIYVLLVFSPRRILPYVYAGLNFALAGYLAAGYVFGTAR